MNNNATLQRIKELKLAGMYSAFHSTLETRGHATLTADELISMLIDAEYNYRRNLCMKMNIKRLGSKWKLLLR